MTITQAKNLLIAQAWHESKVVYPTINKSTFNQCFTIWHGWLMFWFNNEDNTTCVVRCPLPETTCDN